MSDLILWLLGIEAGKIAGGTLAIVGFIDVLACLIGFVALGYLTGIVLRRKLPRFPMHSWLVLYGVCGILLGYGPRMIDWKSRERWTEWDSITSRF